MIGDVRRTIAVKRRVEAAVSRRFGMDVRAEQRFLGDPLLLPVSGNAAAARGTDANQYSPGSRKHRDTLLGRRQRLVADPPAALADQPALPHQPPHDPVQRRALGLGAEFRVGLAERDARVAGYDRQDDRG